MALSALECTSGNWGRQVIEGKQSPNLNYFVLVKQLAVLCKAAGIMSPAPLLP